MRRRKHITELVPIDGKLEQSRIASCADRAYPSGKRIIRIRGHIDLLGPDIGMRACRSIDNHKVARATMTRPMEIRVVILSVGTNIIGPFAIQIVRVSIGRGEACVTLIEIAIEDAFVTWTIARTCVSGSHHG